MGIRQVMTLIGNAKQTMREREKVVWLKQDKPDQWLQACACLDREEGLLDVVQCHNGPVVHKQWNFDVDKN